MDVKETTWNIARRLRRRYEIQLIGSSRMRKRAGGGILASLDWRGMVRSQSKPFRLAHIASIFIMIYWL